MSKANRMRKQVAAEPVKEVVPQTQNQTRYIESILTHNYSICVGPAGTGKTHIAAGVGAGKLYKKEVRKLILTRPIVAAEQIGFLPGDPNDKIHPYLIPLFEELGYFLNVESAIRAKQVFIEPIAFLRGRTIKDAFIIIDEAQNCTYNQLKMIATRLGEGSRMIINGDITQIDLPPDRNGKSQSGLEEFINRISNYPPATQGGVCSITYLGKEDIVRHPSVNILLKALESE